MRALLTAATLLLSAGPALAFFPGSRLQPCDNVPPLSAQQPTTVKIDVYTVPTAQMRAACGLESGVPIIYGCASRRHNDGVWQLVFNSDMDANELACTETYEFAHLPPNNWQDPVMEAGVQHAH